MVKAEKPQPGERKENAPPAMTGGDVGIQLIVSVIVGGAMGYGVDRWLDSDPWGMLLGGGLGFAAWLRLVWKIMR